MLGREIAKARSALKAYVRELRSILRGNVGVMALSWFLFSLTGNLVNPFLAKYAEDLGASETDVAFMRSIGSIALALSIIPGGLITDYMGRVKPIIVGTGLVAVVQFLYGLAPDWRTLTAVYVIDMVSHFYQPALTSIVMDSLPVGMEFKGFLVLNVISSIPGLMVPVFGGVLYDVYGVRGMRLGFIAQGIVALIVLLLRIKMFRETFKPSNKDFSKLIFELAGYRAVLSKAIGVYVSQTLLSLSMGVLGTYGILYAINVLGFSKAQWGLISVASTIGVLIASFGYMNARLRIGKTIVYSSITLALSQFIIALLYYARSYSLILLFLVMIAISIAQYIYNSAVSAVLTRTLPVEIRGRATGIQGIIGNLSSSAASALAGVLYITLNYNGAFVVSGLIGVLNVVYLIVYLKAWRLE
ncbi:MAG: MFS transporter [Desulfurococcus sp.]|nr:MFS transporter [Desulfurococcus sp.]